MIRLSTDILTKNGEQSSINWSTIAWAAVQETDMLLKDIDLPENVHLLGYFVRPRCDYLMLTVYPSSTDETLEWFSVKPALDSLSFILQYLNQNRQALDIENSSKWVQYLQTTDSLRLDLHQFVESEVCFRFDLSL